MTARCSRPFEEIGQHVLRDHVGHLVRNPGHRVHDLVAHLAAETRRGADRVRDRLTALRHVGLPQVVLREGSPAATEDLADVLDELFAPFEFDAHHLGDRLPGHVVGGGPETAADDHGVGPIQQLLDALHHACEVVAHLAVLARVDPHRGELLTDPGTVRVDDLAEQQLGADGEDVTPHGWPASLSWIAGSR